MPTFVLNKGIDPNWIWFPPVLDQVVAAIFGEIGYPPLKSDTVTIVAVPPLSADAEPMYVSNSAVELIVLIIGGNKPWQFAYQLAHELGHLSARADLRFPRSDGLNWIEEVLCEAHSLIAIHHLTAAGPSHEDAAAYDAEHKALTGAPIDAAWFAASYPELQLANGLTAEGKRLARHIFEHVPADRILSDNRAVLRLPVGIGLHPFLDAWQANVGDGQSVPAVLRQLALDAGV